MAKDSDADSSVKRRGRTIPIEDWWGDAVRRELKNNDDESKLTEDDEDRIRQLIEDEESLPDDFKPRNQKELAAKLGIDPGHLNDAIKHRDHARWAPVDYIVKAISDELDLPYPFLIPETEAIALFLAKEHRLRRREAKLGDIKTGVAGNKGESQTTDLSSEHASRSRTKATSTRKRA